MIPEFLWKFFGLVAPPNMPVSTAKRLSQHSWTMNWEFMFMRKSLLVLALTCKSFTEPALDLLWRHLGGLDPLIRCLPQSLWKEDKNKLQFQRPTTFDDWSIFREYNHRVRSLLNQCSGMYGPR
ncbi:uncharacterized protein EDB91DRAFT_1112875 [Suillus paluster]|uniref:uncharacterized protein n=1 Tax=Suillus paluster TaxID=48578 RepID=UPI001B86476E|nr:uncharacterized protein EDB91DRAFT_1112875 [Suillus paluster]KAG1748242.1 hypothetical protein EDB91DRAFT_1112875 [Suillus paluster]